MSILDCRRALEGGASRAQDAQRQTEAVSPVGPQPLAMLARPLGPAARRAGPSAGCGTVDYRESRATSGRITHSRFNRGLILFEYRPDS